MSPRLFSWAFNEHAELAFRWSDKKTFYMYLYSNGEATAIANDFFSMYNMGCEL